MGGTEQVTTPTLCTLSPSVAAPVHSVSGFEKVFINKERFIAGQSAWLGEGLAAGPPDAEVQRVPPGVTDDARNAGGVLDGVDEHHQLHLLGRGVAVGLESTTPGGRAVRRGMGWGRARRYPEVSKVSARMGGGSTHHPWNTRASRSAQLGGGGARCALELLQAVPPRFCISQHFGTPKTKHQICSWVPQQARENNRNIGPQTQNTQVG